MGTKIKYKIVKDINSNEVFVLPLIRGKKEAVGDIIKFYNHHLFYNEIKKCWDYKTIIKDCEIIKISTRYKKI